MPSTNLKMQEIEIAILDGSTAQASTPLQVLQPPSPGEFGRELRKVLDDACCGNLWNRELFFIAKHYLSCWISLLVADWQAHCVKAMVDHMNQFMKGNGVLPLGHDDNALRGLIVRIWSIVQVQTEKSAFSSLAAVVSEKAVGDAMTVHMKLVMDHLWRSALCRMRMVDANRAAIPGSNVTFCAGFGWSDGVDYLFGPAQVLSDRERCKRIKVFIKDMVDRGISIRHQTAHAVGTDQTDPGCHRRRHSSRLSSSQYRATEQAPRGPTTVPMTPNPIDLLFSLIAFDSVRIFFEKK